MTSRSIRSDLVRRLLIALVLVAIGSNAALYFYLRGELTEQYDDALRTEAMAIAAVWDRDGGREEGATRQAAAIARAFDHLHFGGGGGDYLKIIRRDDSIALHVPDVPAGAELRTGDLTPFGTRRRLFDLALPDGRAGRAIAIPFSRRAGGAPRPAEPEFLVVLAEGRRELDQTLAHMALGLVVIGGGLSAVSIGLVVEAVRRGLRPLQTFSESVERLDADSLHLRIPVAELPDELRPISDRLNDMLARLGASFARERRFNENVAHELRTPLAELRTMVEVATRWPPDAPELRRHHASVLGVLHRMSSVVQSLLQLTRPAASPLAASASPVDVVRCIRVAWTSQEADAERRRLAFRLDAPPDAQIAGDTTMLTSIFTNLLSNAVAYAVPASTIDCVVRRDESGAGVVVQLTNATADLSPDDLARLEEPFWRKDAARSSGEHAGLGLALVREYANALGMRLRHVMPEPNRLTAELICPDRAAARRPADRSAATDGPVASPAEGR